MKNKVTRQSNFELMRVISMFMIVIWHVLIGKGNAMNNAQDIKIKLFLEFLQFVVLVHVNSYVLITGYFQCEKKLKVSSIMKNVNMAWFYRVLFVIINIIFNIKVMYPIDYFEQTFPIDLGFYWFIDAYVLLLCISPFLNRYVDSCDEKSLRRTLGVLFVILSVLPYVTALKAFNNGGYSLYNFVLLYLVGAYLKKYPIMKSSLFKFCSKNVFQIICIFTFFFLVSFNFLSSKFAAGIAPYDGMLGELGDSLLEDNIMYSSPLIIVQSIVYFCFFETLTVKSNFINFLGRTCIGVYLIHENPIIKKQIYKWIGLDRGPIYSFKYVPYMLAIITGLFIACAIVEWLRQCIFKFVYNRKFSTKIRQKYRGWIEGCGVNVNW